MEIESKLKLRFPDLKYDEVEGGILIYHPKNSAEHFFELPTEEEDFFKEVTLFKESDYIEGQTVYRDGYYECLINATSIQHPYLIDSTPEFLAPEGTDKSKIYFEIGEVSGVFNCFLENSISHDVYNQEYYHSFKIYNIRMDNQEPDVEIRKKPSC